MNHSTSHGLVNFFTEIGNYYCEFCIIDKEITRLSKNPEFKNLYPPLRTAALLREKDLIAQILGEDIKVICDGKIKALNSKTRWFIYKIHPIPAGKMK